MARIRTIKPSFFMNNELASLGANAQLLFIGLWCLADREGRLPDRPQRIKAEIFPYRGVSIEALLTALESSPDPFIRRYEVDGNRYIQVVHFLDHQWPNVKEPPSTIPAPCKDSASTVLAQHYMEGKGKERKEEILPDSDFAEWYAAYPRKMKPGDARKAYKGARKKADAATLLDGLERAKRYWKREHTERNFIPYPASWLNGERWEDDYDSGGARSEF